MGWRSGVVVVLAALCAAAPARAAVHAVAPLNGLDAGPVIAEGQVFWAPGGRDLRRAPIFGGAPSRLRLPDDGLPAGERTTTLLSGSPLRLAYLQDAQEFGPRPGQDDFEPAHLGSVLGVTVPAQPPAIVVRHRDGTGDAPEVLAADVDDDHLATVEVAPGASEARLVVRDLAAGASPTELAPPAVAPPVRIYRDHVAVYDPIDDAIVVRDRTSGAIELTIPTTPGEFALDRDGRVAYVRGGVLRTATPAEPSPVTLATDASGQAVAMRLGRVFYVRRGTRGVAVAEVAPGVAARTLTWPTRSIGGLSFDGLRIAFATFACVYAGPAGAAQAAPPGGACPAQALGVDFGRAARLDGRRLAVGLTCDEAPAAGCRGTLVVRAAGRRLLRTVVRLRPVASGLVQRRLSARAAHALRAARGQASVTIAGVTRRVVFRLA